MRKINAEIVADSISPQGHRITSFVLTYPRFIHSELMTHRLFSRNSASSRAIPFEKMVKMVEEDPFIPIAWQKDHKGMQGTEYITDENDFGAVRCCIEDWLEARDNAINMAHSLHSLDVTKQLCNRILEPFMWHTVLVTATEFDNFFELRCPKYGGGEFKSKRDVIRESRLAGMPSDYYSAFEIEDWLEEDYSQAEIHIQALAEAMWDEYNQSKPKQLNAGEWHIPFGDQFDRRELLEAYDPENKLLELRASDKTNVGLNNLQIKIATARCARLSYMTFDGKIDYEKDIKLHDQLLESHHMSPFEHCARAMSDEEYNSFIKGKMLVEDEGGGVRYINYLPGNKGWCNNFRGFIQYRHLVENEQ